MPEPELTTEQRIRLLEEHVKVQEQLLIGIQAERIEAERLGDSVERLGTGANALGEALLTVSRQQALLTRLGRELAEVQEKTADLDEKVVSKDDLDELERQKEAERVRREREVEEQRLAREKEAVARRKKRQQQIVAWSVIGLAVLIAGVLAVTVNNAADERAEAEFRQSVYDICQARAEQARRIRAILERSPAETPREEETRRLLISAFPIIPCEGLQQ